jgi:hypothetical protein
MKTRKPETHIQEDLDIGLLFAVETLPFHISHGCRNNILVDSGWRSRGIGGGSVGVVLAVRYFAKHC